MSDLRVPHKLLDRAVNTFEAEARRKLHEAPDRPPRVITISRQLGCGGRKIAECLSRELNVPIWDKEILDVLADHSNLHYQARMFEALDETSLGIIDSMTYAMLGGVSKDVYLYLLPRAILTVAQNDAIILGRGAHLLLPDALKVRVEASLDRRVENMVRFEGETEATARRRIEASDRTREAFLKELSSRLAQRADAQNGKRVQYDLVISTDRFCVQEAAEIVMRAASLRFALESEARGGGSSHTGESMVA